MQTSTGETTVTFLVVFGAAAEYRRFFNIIQNTIKDQDGDWHIGTENYKVL